MPNTSESINALILLLYLFHPFNLITTDRDCQIWDLQLRQCVKSLVVPAFIVEEEKQYLPTMDIDHGLPLTAINYINSNVECLILSYGTHYGRWKGGLLLLENYDLKLWEDGNKLQNNFHPFPSFIVTIYDLNVSNDQQLISIKNSVS